MPLHLLGKKSWNVYNAASIERVRRDEAAARAQEEAEEQRMQEEDAARRTAILRRAHVIEVGAESESAIPLDVNDKAGDAPDWWKRSAEAGAIANTSAPRERQRKRKRVRGEDDTDRDVRIAREDAAIAEKARQTLGKGNASDVDIVDHAGHIHLIPEPAEATLRKAEKNAEAEAEKAKKRQRDEDQYTMRFSNAAGFNKDAGSKPWYASNKLANGMDMQSSVDLLADVQVKDVWGNDDPKRKGREDGRISANDPFAAMQQAQRQLKQSERDREHWTQSRLAELDGTGGKERQGREKRRHRRDEDQDSLEDFKLDGPRPMTRDGRDDERARHHRRRHKHRSRSRSRERHHHRRHRSSRK